MKTSRGFSVILGFFRQKQPGTPGTPTYDSALCTALMTAASAEAASVWERDRQGRLYLVYGTNVLADDVGTIFLEPGEGISGAAAMKRETIAVSQVWSNRLHNRQLDMAIDFRTRSIISAPVLFNNDVYGVINILNYRLDDAFPHQWEERLSAVGVLYGQALALAGRLNTEERPPATLSGRGRCGLSSRKTQVIGISPAIQEVLYLAVKAGRTDIPVLIYGETGTGKEVTARRIHEASPRGKGPFLGVNCAALTETILESELFGHVKGAFSGATANRKGKFIAASGGTLFLDEIGDMSLSCQAKILRVLQEKKVVPVGSESEIDCSVRIVAATHTNLAEQVKQGRFREDLFYRLCGLEIHLPPLRQRREDIDLLATHFLARAAGPQSMIFSKEAIDILKAFAWPGNVRQLEQAVLAAMTVCETSLICPEQLPAWLHKAIAPAASPGARFPGNTLSSQVHRIPPGMDTRDEPERERYLETLFRTRYPGTGRWNVAAAARDLGIARKTLIYRMKKLEIVMNGNKNR